MNKLEIKGLDLTLYEEKLENGLSIYVIPKEKSKGIYATFTTKFGGHDLDFIPEGKEEMLSVPAGIAHFLEHKMFAQKSNEDVMSLFSKNGVSCNANTSSYKTCYLFDGSSHFEENLNLLLDYVQEPYFTDENVEKEKHIIEQEIDMSADNPYSVGYFRLMENLFVCDPSRIRVIGSKESVNSITKEDLYTCYETFYHPGNMFVIVTGNVDPKQTIEIIKKNQEKKLFKQFKKPTLKHYEEPVSVFKKEDTIEMNITVPKLTLGFKFDLKKLEEELQLDEVSIRRYVAIYANLKFGTASCFLEEAKKEELTTSDMDYSLYATDDILVFILEGDSKNALLLKDRILKEVGDVQIDTRSFELKKRGMIASCIYTSENIYSLNQKVLGDVISMDTVEVAILENYKKLNDDDFMRVIGALDFTNYSFVTVNPKKK